MPALSARTLTSGVSNATSSAAICALAARVAAGELLPPFALGAFQNTALVQSFLPAQTPDTHSHQGSTNQQGEVPSCIKSAEHILHTHKRAVHASEPPSYGTNDS